VETVTDHRKMDRSVIVLEGEVFSELSLSRVNREIAVALARRGDVELGISAPLSGPYLQNPQVAALRERVGATLSRPPDLFVRHRWPPDFTRPSHGRYAHVQPWEYGELPVAWAEAVRSNVNEVWCYSRYVRDMYLRAGIDRARLVLLPLGIDPAVFRPDGPTAQLATRASFRILFLGGTIWRKGADLALNAFARAFGPSDDVCLIVKDVGAQTSYRGQNSSEQIRGLVGRADLPEIHYLDETLDDATLAALYRTVDVVLHPYRGEGFGLPMLEAMACGTPAIVTAGGAADDFIDDTVGVRVLAERIAVSSVGLEPLVGEPWALEIPVDRLAAVLRTVAGKREALRALGAAGAVQARTSWSWDATAAIVAERVAAARFSAAQPAVP
jgi:glycosyltransferase involved in cell wall biosynthesis